MKKFIELRFGQGDLGREILGQKDTGEFYVQKEIVPVNAIKDAFVILPEKRNIRISFEIDGRLFKRTEYYADEIDCIKRWAFLLRKLGAVSDKDMLKMPRPLAMDVTEMEKAKAERAAKEGQKDADHDYADHRA